MRSTADMDINGLFDALMSDALASGLFETVNGHEPPANSPGNGLTCAVWVNDIRAMSVASGIDAVTVRITFNIRIFSNAQQDPPDAIDPNLLSAVVTLIGAYVGQFTLGGVVRNVDVFGEYGVPLSATAGYLEPAGGAVFRVMTITLPVTVNDVWSEVA